MKVKKRLLAVVLALAAMSGTTLATAGSASASAYGCTGYGSGITWEGFYVKNGTWCGGVVGSGTYIKYISGNFYTHIILNTVCNFRMRADFYAANGAWYGWAETGIQYRCSNASDLPNIGLYQNVRVGMVRISLLSNGSTVAAVGESIEP